MEEDREADAGIRENSPAVVLDPSQGQDYRRQERLGPPGREAEATKTKEESGMPNRPKLREKLTYANVMVTILAFVVLGGGGAFAALGKNTVGTKQLKKKSVGTKQLKGNAVTKNKIKKNSVVVAKIRNGAVTTNKVQNNAINGAKIADGSVTGAEIDAPSTPFARIVHMATGNSTQSIFGGATIYPLSNNTYTQKAGELNQFAAALDVRFEVSCTPPRSANAYLLVDPANPEAIEIEDIAALGSVNNSSAGTFSTRMALGPAGGLNKSLLFQPAADTPHTLYLVAQGGCGAGSAVNATFGGIDVIGTK